MTQLNDAYADVPLAERKLLFESHIKEFGAECHQHIGMGRKYEFKPRLYPKTTQYDYHLALDRLRRHVPVPDFQRSEGYKIWCKAEDAPSVRPEPNDQWMRPFGAGARCFKINPFESDRSLDHYEPKRKGPVKQQA